MAELCNQTIEMPLFIFSGFQGGDTFNGGTIDPWSEVSAMNGGTFSPWNAGASLSGGGNGYYEPNLDIRVNF